MPRPRYLACHLGVFLRKISIDYIRYGYWRYALRQIPAHKDLESVDRKLLSIYRVSACRVTRQRQRQQGLANVQYVRYNTTFVLLATEGEHEEFDRVRWYDIRQSPLHLFDYSIGVRGNRSVVEVSRNNWREVEAQANRLALRPHKEIEAFFHTLPYYRFPGVVRQQQRLCSIVNQHRKQAGLPRVSLPAPRPKPYRKAS